MKKPIFFFGSVANPAQVNSELSSMNAESGQPFVMLL
jgi:hypothetical protein